MEKLQLNDQVRCLRPKFIKDGQMTRIYQLSDGRIFKYFDPDMLYVFKMISFDFENKILNSEYVDINPSIIRPNAIVYDEEAFVGYVMRRAFGIDYNTWESNLTINQQKDLFQYGKVHFNLESIVKSTSNIVYPDLCTCDNIFVCGDKVELIDYDGMQVGLDRSPALSTTLSESLFSKYLTEKKYVDNDLYTKELDKASLIFLYFLTTFHINLTKVGLVNPNNGCEITLDDMFEVIGLEDYDVMNKVWKIFQKDKENEYLGEDVFRIADDYRMEIFPNPLAKDVCVKRLVRK